MDWLTNWDDLVHGTAVFGAAVPFLVGLLMAWKLPERFWFLGVGVALVGSLLWLFQVPSAIPRSSDDVALFGLGLSLVVLSVAPGRHGSLRVVLGVCALGLLGWSIYPAWLQEGGALSRKLEVVGGLTVSAVLVAVLAELAHRPGEGVATSAFIPPSVALAALLQMGGAARFGQAVAALAAALGAVVVMLLIRRSRGRPASVAALWAVLFVLFAWSGWLFAEIRYGLAALLLFAPLAAWCIRQLPLPRAHPFFDQLWDGLASAAVSGAVAGLAISEYVAEMDEFEGY